MNKLRPVIWNRLRFQLTGGIIAGAVLPWFVRYQSLSPEQNPALINNTFVGTVVAILIGVWLMRNLTIYPGSETLSATLPSFIAGYGILIIVFFFFRIPYNRGTLLAACVLTTLWFFVTSAIAQQRRVLRIGLVPLGETWPFDELPNVSVRVLHAPDTSVADLDAIVVDLRVDLPNEWDRRLADYALQRMPIYHSKHLAESLTGRVELVHLSENSAGSLAPRYDYMVAKSIIDWFTALVAGILLSPVLFVIALLVRLSSPGPALFRQERMGFQGRPFTMYKFRTMRTLIDSEPGQARSLAITRDSDDRVTHIGRFLRKTRLDELPQLFNILRGEMSWIGPRPEAMVLSHWYEENIPFYRYRHVIRPGIAGWAQVRQGHVAEIDEVRSKLYYDFYYIKHYSPWIDLLIVVRTVWIMISGFGAR